MGESESQPLSRDARASLQVVREVFDGSPPVTGPVVRTSRKGIVREALRVAEASPGAVARALRAGLAVDQARSPILRFLIEVWAEALLPGRWLELRPPHVIEIPSEQTLRFGLFDRQTERDGFIKALIGRPVPQRPRYLATMPDMPALVAGDLQSAAKSAGIPLRLLDQLFGAGPLDRASRQALIESLDLGPRDPFVIALVRSLAAEPETLDGLPAFDVIEKVARAAPGWRTLTGRLAAEFYAIEPGPDGPNGAAWWLPGGHGSRAFRASFAAHLRYLFDYEIAPWNRWPDGPRRREVAVLCRIRWLGLKVPMAEVVSALHATSPKDYADEAPKTTRTRLYELRRSLRT